MVGIVCAARVGVLDTDFKLGTLAPYTSNNTTRAQRALIRSFGRNPHSKQRTTLRSVRTPVQNFLTALLTFTVGRARGSTSFRNFGAL